MCVPRGKVYFSPETSYVFSSYSTSLSDPLWIQAVKLQRYMVLHGQQSNIRRRLSIASSSPPLSPISAMSSPDISASEASSTASSTTSSPTLQSRSFSQITPTTFALPKPARNRKTSSRSPSITPIPEEAVAEPLLEIASPVSYEDDRLYDVNYEIKTTLTDLLNCDAVRNDGKMRLWIQTKLMDAELELKRQRKRRTRTPSIVISSCENEDRRATL